MRPLEERDAAAARSFDRHVKWLAGAQQPAEAVPAAPPGRALARPASVIGMAASVGGPSALRTVLSALPRDFAIPIVVVQHMASGFLDGFVRWLDRQVALPVETAADGGRLGPGVWIAPEDAHLVLEDDLTTRLDRETDGGYHRPAADILFASLASVAGATAVAVVLTGMGRDGANGTAAVRARGGLTIAQDEASAAIHGMPRAAAERGAQHVLSLADIGPALGRLLLVAGRTFPGPGRFGGRTI